MVDFGQVSLLVLLAALLLLLIWVLRPLWQGQAPPSDSAPLTLALLAERESALASLRDLDSELQAGRIAGELHSQMREDLLSRGARVLAALDRLAEDRAGQTARLTAALEAEVEALLDSELETRTVCARCQRPATPGDRFCSGCGRALIDEPADA